jgi:hypothetical protein
MGNSQKAEKGFSNSTPFDIKLKIHTDRTVVLKDHANKKINVGGNVGYGGFSVGGNFGYEGEY